jgi:hypothetical protein
MYSAPATAAAIRSRVFGSGAKFTSANSESAIKFSRFQRFGCLLAIPAVNHSRQLCCSNGPTVPWVGDHKHSDRLRNLLRCKPSLLKLSIALPEAMVLGVPPPSRFEFGNRDSGVTEALRQKKR